MVAVFRKKKKTPTCFYENVKITRDVIFLLGKKNRPFFFPFGWIGGSSIIKAYLNVRIINGHLKYLKP